MVGRPTLLTPKILKAICRELRAGNTRRDAALLADVSVSSFMVWMQRAAKGETEFIQFAQSVRKAEAAARRERIARIRKAGKKGTWLADAWMLERRDPEHFATNNREIKEIQKEIKELKKVVGIGDKDGILPSIAGDSPASGAAEIPTTTEGSDNSQPDPMGGNPSPPSA